MVFVYLLNYNFEKRIIQLVQHAKLITKEGRYFYHLVYFNFIISVLMLNLITTRILITKNLYAAKFFQIPVLFVFNLNAYISIIRNNDSMHEIIFMSVIMKGTHSFISVIIIFARSRSSAHFLTCLMMLHC